MNNIKKITTIIVVLSLLVAVGIRLSSNHKKINSSKNLNSGISSIVSVETYKIEPMDIDQSIKLVGTMFAISDVNIVAEAQGKITSLNVEPGQVKSQGSVIATIDNKLKQLAVNSAQVALAKQKKDLSRFENLVKGGGATQQQLDDARTSYENALITLEQNQKQLADATVKAPITGIITQKLVDKGAFVNVGTPLASIVDISKLKLKLNASESDAYKIKVGEIAQITTDIYPDKTFEGRVSFISAKGDENHIYNIEIVVTNNNKTPLKAGTFANVTINRPSAGKKLYIPRESLLGSSRDAKVYVVHNGTAILRDIVVSEANNKYLEVKSGLSANDVIVTSGQINLENGKPVKEAHK
jgi:RND family efflux transporter, MFP subunit